jgi:hypothetical protein
MSNLVNDTVIVTAAAASLGLVLVGGIYYSLPTWRQMPSRDTVEETLASIATAPITVAGRIGSNLGTSVMKAAGYTYTASELEQLRPKLFALANVPHTPENAAQQLYEIMMSPGQSEQLTRLRTHLLGRSDTEWNRSVADAYFPMYKKSLEDAILLYMTQQGK